MRLFIGLYVPTSKDLNLTWNEILMFYSAQFDSAPTYLKEQVASKGNTIQPCHFFLFFYVSVRKVFMRAQGPGARVTRLGEFSPIGRLFASGIFLKITEVVQIFGLLFPRYTFCSIFTKCCWDTFFTSASGHPDRSSPRTRFFPPSSFRGKVFSSSWQGCQIFLGTRYQNGGKYTKSIQNMPNVHKIFPMAVK
jgi:hypothetical protein